LAGISSKNELGHLVRHEHLRGRAADVQPPVIRGAADAEEAWREMGARCGGVITHAR
jgi:hypothetical protein